MTSQEAFRTLSKAIRAGNTDEVLSMFQSDLTLLDMITPFGSWLHVAASRGRLEIVRWLVDMGADVNLRAGTFDGAPINLAAANGHEDIVRLLLEVGAKLDVSEPERNPLFSAVYGGHIAIVRLLIEAGIDPSIRYTGKSMKNMDAKAFALERGQLDIATFLADT